MPERERLEQAIATLEAQRRDLGGAAVGAALASLRQKLTEVRRAEEDPPSTPAAFASERKLVTIMFADLSGFTAMSERMDPEAVRELMNDCFDHLVPVVEKYEGTVDKFIGDEIMALFGAPAAHENDAERALTAAVEMMDVLKAFNTERDIQLGMHIGINTGLVIAGGMGSSGRQQYSVMGDAVNLASRLEDASEKGEILVGPDTYRLVGPLFDFDSPEAIRVKGKAEPVRVYRLRGKKKRPVPLRGIEGLHSPLVGREVTLRQLEGGLSALREGRGGLMAITGGAGLGKSRLVAEIRQTQGEGLTWVEGRAVSIGQGVSYGVIRGLLRHQLGIDFETHEDEVADTLRENLARLLPEQIEAVYPFLANLLELPLDEGTAAFLQQFSFPDLQGKIRSAVADYLRALGQEQPVVLVGEDLHWADPLSLHLLEALLPLANEVPILFLLVFRLEGEQITAFHQQVQDSSGEKYQELALKPLTQEESTQLVQNLLRIENLPAETSTLILDKTDGNPFFVEEILRSLLDAGLVVLQGEQATITRPITAIDVPDTLQGIIAARIDRLPPKDKHTLQQASVIGRIFHQRVLAYLSTQESSNVPLDPSLSELRRRELIRRRGMAMVEEDPEYIFKHVVTWEVTYNSLLLSQRRELHQVAGNAIESLFPDQLDQLSPTLAYHFYQAGAFDRALKYLLEAGRRAQKAFAYKEARRFLEQGRVAAAALDSSVAQGPLREILMLLARIEDRTGNPEAALALCRQVLEENGDDRAVAGRALLLIGWVEYRKGNWAAAVRLCEEVLEIFTGLGDEKRIALVYVRLGNIAFEHGELEQAEKRFRGAKDTAVKCADYYLLGSIYGNLGILATVRGQFAEAELHYTEALKAYRAIDHRYGLCQTFHNMGMMHANQQKWQAALDYYAEGREQAREMGTLDVEANILVSQAVAQISVGDLERAETSCAKGRVYMEQLGDRLGVAECRKIEGMILRERADYERAAERLMQGRTLFEELRNRLGMAECDLELGRLQQQRGDVEEARQYLEKSRRLFHEIGAEEDARRAEDLLSALPS